jgi:hypothetical protein
MMIEFGIEWALNQSDEFKVINSLTTPKSQTHVEHVGTLLEQCWHFVGTMLALCWNNVGTLLEQCWHFVGTMLALCWNNFGTLLE